VAVHHTVAQAPQVDWAAAVQAELEILRQELPVLLTLVVVAALVVVTAMLEPLEVLA
jgi:hypothetical protein